jgi:hypothetical protein
MRRFLVCGGVILVGSFLGNTAARAQVVGSSTVHTSQHDHDHFHHGHFHHDHHHDGHHHGHHHHSVQSGGWFLWTGYPLVWSSGYSTPAFAYYPRVFNPGFINAAPQMNLVPQVAPQAAIPLAQPPAPAPANAAPKGKPKPTNADQKAKAGKFIGFGDTNFGNQKYLTAVERYKTAARLAPDLADPYLRQGHALVALGQYENAVKAFRRGLRIQGDWADSPFRLDRLYAQEPLAKISHIERLAKAVEDNPLDSDLLIALGMQMYFDGQHERAGVFFARAAQLGGNDDRLLDGFLPKPAPAGAPQPAAGKIVF